MVFFWKIRKEFFFSRLFNIERLRRDFISESSDTDTEDEVENIYGSSSRVRFILFDDKKDFF